MRTIKPKLKTVTIYGLIDPRNNRLRYIGKTIHLEIRIRQHINDTRKNHHKSNWIQILCKSGLTPEIVILEKVFEKDWVEREQFWIAHYQSLGIELINISKGGDDNSRSGKEHAMYGKHHSEETRCKMRESHKNRLPITEETRNKLLIAAAKRKGKPGKPLSQEGKDKVSAFQKGRPKSEEQKRKVSIALKGKTKSIEHCLNMSKSQMGKIIKEETKRKISESTKGKAKSKETKQRMSLARIQLYENKRKEGSPYLASF